MVAKMRLMMLMVKMTLMVMTKAMMTALAQTVRHKHTHYLDTRGRVHTRQHTHLMHTRLNDTRTHGAYKNARTRANISANTGL